MALLTLVFYLVSDTAGDDTPAGSLSLFSGRSVSILSILCVAVGGIAGGAAVFFVGRAFYLGFARPKLREGDGHDA